MLETTESILIFFGSHVKWRKKVFYGFFTAMVNAPLTFTIANKCQPIPYVLNSI